MVCQVVGAMEAVLKVFLPQRTRRKHREHRVVNFLKVNTLCPDSYGDWPTAVCGGAAWSIFTFETVTKHAQGQI